VGRRSVLALLAGASLPLGRLSLAPAAAAQVSRTGFIGELDFRVIEIRGEVRFELVNDFGYIDSTGRRWQAKKGLLTDGASIPLPERFLSMVISGGHSSIYDVRGTADYRRRVIPGLLGRAVQICARRAEG